MDHDKYVDLPILAHSKHPIADAAVEVDMRS